MIEGILLFNGILLIVIVAFCVVIDASAYRFEHNFVNSIHVVTWTSLSVITITTLFTIFWLAKIPTVDDVIKGNCVKQYIIENDKVIDSCYIWKNI